VTPAQVASPQRIPGEHTNPDGPELLRVTGLTRHFSVTAGRVLRREVGRVQAVDDLSFVVYEGETLGVVGESGCGKSTAIRAILRLVEPTRGDVVCLGRDVRRAGREELRTLRRDMQVVLQDPFASLNPRLKVGQIVAEPLEIHRMPRGRERVSELLAQVRLAPEHAARYPRELSGGERQRIAIARALATCPKVVFCDEPVSSLDVSIRGHVLDLLADLKDELGLSYVMVSHDLSVVRHVADKVAVMYLGEIVELAKTDDLYEAPRHPYTVALLSAIPIPDPPRERERRPRILSGELPSPTEPPPGCRFHTRCWKAQEICRSVAPPLVERVPSHWVACHFPEGDPGARHRQRNEGSRKMIDRQTLDRVVDFHGHMCPGLAMGIQAAQIAVTEFGPDDTDDEVVAVVETDMCAVDAIQFMIGCTLGRGNLIHRDYGKNAYTFYGRRSGRAVRVCARAGAWRGDPEHAQLFAKVVAGEASVDEEARLWELHHHESDRILEMDPVEIFDVSETHSPAPPKAQIHPSAPCAECGEETQEPKLSEVGGRRLCTQCLGRVVAHPTA